MDITQIKAEENIAEALKICVFGPIPWGHSGPLCHALSFFVVVVVVDVVVDIDAQAARDSTASDIC